MDKEEAFVLRLSESGTEEFSDDLPMLLPQIADPVPKGLVTRLELSALLFSFVAQLLHEGCKLRRLAKKAQKTGDEQKSLFALLPREECKLRIEKNEQRIDILRDGHAVGSIAPWSRLLRVIAEAIMPKRRASKQSAQARRSKRRAQKLAIAEMVTTLLPTPRMHANPMLVVLIHNALTDASSGGGVESAATNAAVHAWYEGHCSAEDASRPASIPTSEALAEIPEDVFPMPPFPRPPDVQTIVDETLSRFGSEMAMKIPAIAYAAALAWERGIKEGRMCRGCSFRGLDPDFARAVRMGELDVEMLFVDRETGERFPSP